jgi:hypothetical protein
MVNLTPLAIDYVQTFQDIGNDKYNLAGNNRKDRILALVPTITPRYALYEHHFNANTLENIAAVNYSQQTKQDLLHCYTSETASLNRLVAAIKDNQLFHLMGICQFCGINTDSTTDHYLPKDSFPDFCVAALNLFPCCPDCNSLKGEYMWDALHNTRGIINFYTDVIPAQQFLYANITYNGDVPTVHFHIQNISGINLAFYNIIERHFDRLNLLERYKEKFNSLYNQTRSSFKNKPRFAGHPGRVRDFLLDDAAQLFADYGRNYYIGIVKEALGNNNTFVNQF